MLVINKVLTFMEVKFGFEWVSEIEEPRGIIGGPIQCVVSYRDQCAHKHTNMSLYKNNIRLATLASNLIVRRK